MREIIQNKLKEIEAEFQVKILYTVESGSRAWGFPSKDSDFDVRFIYIHQPDWYLSIDPQGVGTKRDVIELPINELLDISGWEITKALRLFRKSNPSLLEWMKSDIVYLQAYSFIDNLRTLEPEVFQPISSLYHYLNMARNNYREYLQGPEVKIKKYFYALRPILACQWIETHKSVPPIDFSELVNSMIPAGELRTDIEHLLVKKIAGDEMDWQPRIQVINDFLERELIRLEVYIKTISVEVEDSTKKLDELFRYTLTEVWE